MNRILSLLIDLLDPPGGFLCFVFCFQSSYPPSAEFP